jgi:hypothetical protein
MLASGDDRPAAAFARNNPETKFYSSEKLTKKIKDIKGAVAVRTSAATLVSGVTDITNAQVHDQLDGCAAQHFARHGRDRSL